MRIASSLVGLLILLIAVPVASQAPDDKLVVPGVRIGKWTLEMTIDDLVRMNGRTQIRRLSLSDAAQPFQEYCWVVEGAAFCAYSSDGRNVPWLRVAGGEFRTEKGVAFRSPKAEVERAYGKPTAETRADVPGGEAQRMIYDEVGFSATIVLEGGNFVVHSLIVFRPGKAKELWKF